MAIAIVTPTAAGVSVTPGQMLSSEAINGNLVGGTLVVANGSGGSVNVTISDPGRTKLGNTGTNSPRAVATGTSWAFDLTDGMVNSADNTITVAVSATGATITGVVYP